MPSEAKSAAMYEAVVETLENHGFERYEVSNFAVNANARSKHNLHYWNGGQYIGVGPGAHGRVIDPATGFKERRVGTPSPARWMKEVTRNGNGLRLNTTMSLQDCLEELLISGLRTVDGVSSRRWNEILEAHSKSPVAASAFTRVHQRHYPTSSDEVEDGLSLKNVFGMYDRLNKACKTRLDGGESRFSSHDNHLDSPLLQTLFEDDFLHYANDGLTVPKKSLAVLDSILPHILHHLGISLSASRLMF